MRVSEARRNVLDYIEVFYNNVIFGYGFGCTEAMNCYRIKEYRHGTEG